MFLTLKRRNIMQMEFYILMAVVVAIVLVTAAVTTTFVDYVRSFFTLKQEEWAEIFHDGGVALMTAGIGLIIDGQHNVEGVVTCFAAFVALRVSSQLR
jgi:hypothetical protein